MNLPLRFRDEIPDDIAAACHWYEERQEGLGQDFLEELPEVLQRITGNPEMYAVRRRDVRSARMHRFPYVVYYRIIANSVAVIAVMFGVRDPSAWQDRI
ncbi:MAG: type II toxin-antitoxin system RelE/ParE family toxin [Pirellulaceae bacterium]